MIAIEDVSIKSGLEALSKMLRGKCSRFINIMHTSQKFFFKLKTVIDLFTHDPLQMTWCLKILQSIYLCVHFMLFINILF